MAYNSSRRPTNNKSRCFINDQPIAHQKLLKSMADELAVHGIITHPQATRNSKGDWSILLNDNGDVYVYTLFISNLEKKEANNETKTETHQIGKTSTISLTCRVEWV